MNQFNQKGMLLHELILSASITVLSAILMMRTLNSFQAKSFNLQKSIAGELEVAQVLKVIRSRWRGRTANNIYPQDFVIEPATASGLCNGLSIRRSGTSQEVWDTFKTVCYSPNTASSNWPTADQYKAHGQCPSGLPYLNIQRRVDGVLTQSFLLAIGRSTYNLASICASRQAGAVSLFLRFDVPGGKRPIQKKLLLPERERSPGIEYLTDKTVALPFIFLF